jgi:hypothetical protein
MLLLFTEPLVGTNALIAAKRHIAKTGNNEQLWFAYSIASPSDEDSSVAVISNFNKHDVKQAHYLSIDLNRLCKPARLEAMDDPLSAFFKNKLYTVEQGWSLGDLRILTEAVQLLIHARLALQKYAVHFDFGLGNHIFTQGLSQFTGQEMEFF